MNSELFPNSQLYDTGYCVIFTKHVPPADLLSRVAGRAVTQLSLNRLEAEIIEAQGEEIEEEDVPELDLDEIRDGGFLDSSGPLVRCGTHGDWSFVVETSGSYLARDEVISAVSQGTVALSLRETGSTWIAYAEYGTILSSLDPLFPEHDYGKRPEVLANLSGFRTALDAGDRSDAYEIARRRIQEALGCAMPQEVDDARLLAARIPDVY
ncbi:DUF6461 domain-containing protein [Streptomyces sp. NPDC001507]|uniref:DUF6461 domain-containing protein n=1 Tax=Streptomyces sp. NPDC001507 TaxID=3364579 RepID=UPI00367BA987